MLHRVRQSPVHKAHSAIRVRVDEHITTTPFFCTFGSGFRQDLQQQFDIGIRVALCKMNKPPNPAKLCKAGFQCSFHAGRDFVAGTPAPAPARIRW